MDHFRHDFFFLEKTPAVRQDPRKEFVSLSTELVPSFNRIGKRSFEEVVVLGGRRRESRFLKGLHLSPVASMEKYLCT